jgi:hypothetical protein
MKSKQAKKSSFNPTKDQTMNQLFSPEELTDIVDTLADIRAKIADLKTSEETYKAALIAAEVRAVDGTLHSATVSEPVYRKTIDWQTIARKLEPSAQLLRAHTTTATEPSYTVKVTARKATA